MCVQSWFFLLLPNPSSPPFILSAEFPSAKHARLGRGPPSKNCARPPMGQKGRSREQENDELSQQRITAFGFLLVTSGNCTLMHRGSMKRESSVLPPDRPRARKKKAEGLRPRNFRRSFPPPTFLPASPAPFPPTPPQQALASPLPPSLHLTQLLLQKVVRAASPPPTLRERTAYSPSRTYIHTERGGGGQPYYVLLRRNGALRGSNRGRGGGE